MAAWVTRAHAPAAGPRVRLPRADIAARDTQLEQALRTYEQEVLGAFEETENAFVARDRAELKSLELGIGLKSARHSVEMARELYLQGLADFISVLDAQRQQFALEREVAACNAVLLRQTVVLYKALGG